jgi:glycosidase
LQRLLAFFQMTALGAPMVYYGDEAGLWGANDPCCRKPMVWPELRFEAEATHPDGTPRDAADAVGFDAGLHAHYRRAIALRHALPVLRKGRVHTLLADDARQVLVHLRQAGNDLAVVVINRSDADPQVIELTVPTGRTWTDAWNGGAPQALAPDRLKLRPAGLSGAVLQAL